MSRKAGRVLVVTNRLPFPLDDGWKRRTYHVLRAIAAHRPVTLATLHDRSADELDALRDALGADLEILTAAPSRLTRAASVPLGILTSTPYHVWKQRSLALRRRIEHAVARGRFELGVATLVQLFPYLDRLPESVARVVDTHNIDSLLMRRYAQWSRGPLAHYASLTASRLEAFEQRVFRRATRVFVCSDPEVAEVRLRAPSATVRVIPNGVDSIIEFAPDPDIRPVPQRILFFGRLDYFPNVDAVEHFLDAILPRIHAQVPGLEFRVVGPGGSAALRSSVERTPACRYVGRVEDLRAEVAAAAVVVVPLRVGGGTRLKILESLSLERPVVSTPLGAEGLDLVDRRDLVLAEDPAGFADAVLRLLNDPDGANALAGRGRATVRDRYDWGAIEERIATELGFLAKRGGPVDTPGPARV